MLDDIIQASILGGSAVAVWLFTRPGRQRMVGFALNLSIEPLWLYSSWKAQQWGVVLLTLFYSYNLANGILIEWRNRNAPTR